MLTVAFGESIMSRTQVQLCYNQFKEGRENVNDDGRPSTSTTDENTETVKKKILDNRREFADDVGISFGSLNCAITGLRSPVKMSMTMLDLAARSR